LEEQKPAHAAWIPRRWNMKAIWKGHIQFSLVTIPILVYSAVDAKQIISFHMLHSKDHGRINYDKKCSKCKRIVATEEIVKGYEYEPDHFVIVEKEDFDRINLKSTKILQIQGFIDAKDIHPTLYDTPYYAGPDGAVAVKPYSLLASVLRETGKIGIGKAVLHERENVMAISHVEKALVLYRLRPPEEIKSIADIPQLDSKPLEKEELKLAHSLIASMSAKLSGIDMSDTYHDALRSMIDAKIKGKEIVTVEQPEAPVIDIMTALKKSMEHARLHKNSSEKTSVRTEIDGEAKTQARAEILDLPRKKSSLNKR
jgi:DNA end-binding protein Ku